MAIIRRRVGPPATPAIAAPAPTGKGPVKRGTLGSKPTINVSLEALTQVTQTTNYRLVIQRYRDKVHNPKSAIRAHCVECSGGSLKEVQECKVTLCALHPFRMGENPFHLKTIKRLAAQNGEDGPDDEPETGESE